MATTECFATSRCDEVKSDFMVIGSESSLFAARRARAAGAAVAYRREAKSVCQICDRQRRGSGVGRRADEDEVGGLTARGARASAFALHLDGLVGVGEVWLVMVGSSWMGS